MWASSGRKRSPVSTALKKVFPANNFFLWFAVLSASWLAHSTYAQSKTSSKDDFPADFVLRKIVLREASDIIGKRLGYKTSFTSQISGNLPKHVGLRRLIEQVNGFPNLEDSIFTHRPNVLETTVGVRNLGEYRLSWAGLVMGCYSPAKDNEMWTETSWAELPRPVSVSTKKEIPEGDPAMRTWASTPELNGDSDKDLSWCLSPPGFVEQPSIELNFTLAATILAAGDYTLDSLVTALQGNIDDPREMMRLMRASFNVALEERWTIANSVVRVRVSGTDLKKASHAGLVLDYSTSGIQAEVAMLLQRGRTMFFNNIWGRQALVDFTREVEPPAVANTELLLAVTSAVGGTVMEDIILQKVLEGRTFVRSYQEVQSGEITYYVNAILRFTLVLFMAAADMLPLIYVYLQEKYRAAWVGQAVRSYFGARPLAFREPDKTRPSAHAIYLTLETWRIQVVGTRHRLAGILLVIAIILHLFMLGYRAWFLVFSHIRQQMGRLGTLLQTKLLGRRRQRL